MKRHDERHRLTGAAAASISVFLVVTSVTLATGCSSTPRAGEPATLVYVGSSDDTWTAVHIVLIELDYDVDEENRDEGTIRATRTPDGDREGSVLTIDQVARTETISLYVRVEAAPGDPPMDESRRRELAEEFLEPVNKLLYE